MKEHSYNRTEGRCPSCGGPVREVRRSEAVCEQCGAELIEKTTYERILKVSRRFSLPALLILLTLAIIVWTAYVFLMRMPQPQFVLDERVGRHIPRWTGLVGLVAICFVEIALANLPPKSPVRGKIMIFWFVVVAITCFSWSRMEPSAAVPLVFVWLGCMCYRLIKTASRLKGERP